MMTALQKDALNRAKEILESANIKIYQDAILCKEVGLAGTAVNKLSSDISAAERLIRLVAEDKG